MPNSILLPEEDEPRCERHIVSEISPLQRMKESEELLTRFDPDLVGFGIITPSPYDFLQAGDDVLDIGLIQLTPKADCEEEK